MMWWTPSRVLKRSRKSARCRDFDSISVAFKRIKNILRQAAEQGNEARRVDSTLFPKRPRKRKRLAAQMFPARLIAGRIAAREQKDYRGAAADAFDSCGRRWMQFFDKVMVMVDDEQVAGQPAGLAATMLNEFSTIADFSEIVTREMCSPRQYHLEFTAEDSFMATDNSP